MPIEQIEFVLNGCLHSPPAGTPPTTTVLDYLRRVCRLTGTKEGCAEGDCGACTIVLTELSAGQTTRRAVNACIQFLPMLAGKAITTVEHVQGPGGELHPCQQALVDCHGSQCGFCTPGFVMTLHAAHGSGAAPSDPEIDDMLAGNLCRCTGYGPIVEAARRMAGMPRPDWEQARQARTARLLATLRNDREISYRASGQTFIAPATIAGLARTFAAHPEATIVAGATDVGLWVTKQQRRLDTLIHIGRIAELQTIVESGDRLHIGAGVTYTDALVPIARLFPDFAELLRRLGSPLIRNAGTIGGNIANASPIGDAIPALIAIGAELILRRGDQQRRLALEAYFLGHGRQDRQPGEFVERVEIPLGQSGRQLRCYKISKRFDQDISAVCGCFNIGIEAGLVATARIAFGGMAGTPKRAGAVETALLGKPWTLATVEAARAAFADDFTPISDLRASAAYRRRIAENLLLKYFHETQRPPPATRLAGHAAVIG